MNWQAIKLVEYTCDDCIINRFAKNAVLGRTPALRDVVRRTLEDFLCRFLKMRRSEKPLSVSSNSMFLNCQRP
jgi:hypothetical protein